MACMVLNTFTARLQRLVGSKSKAAAAVANEKRNSHTMQISAPFNFKHETINLPGLSEDDLASLKQKALASHLGVGAESVDHASGFGSSRKAPRAPLSPARPAAPMVIVTPGTPLSPKDHVF